MRKWLVIVGAVVVILGVAGFFTLRWARRRLPDYVRDRAISTLRERFDSEAEFNNSTGIKSLLLKPVDPLFEKRGAGTLLPIKVTGYSTHPSFRVELGRVFKR